MTGNVVLKPRARQDLVDHYSYIAQGSLRAADRFLQAADETFARIVEMPGLASLHQSDHPRLTGLRHRRVAGFKNYLIFYRPTKENIDVIRVLHAARDLETVLEAEELDESS